MKRGTPRNITMEPQGAGANHSPSLSRMDIIVKKIRSCGISPVDVAEAAGVRFSDVYGLLTLGLIGHRDLAALENLFSEEVRHAH